MFKNVLKSMGFAFLIVLFPVLAGVVIQIKRVSQLAQAYWIQAVFFAIACIVGFFIFQKYRSERPVTTPRASLRGLLWFLPLVVAEAVGLVASFSQVQQTSFYLTVIVFLVLVAISEELFFRGIILTILSREGTTFAVVVSAVMFAILHLTNLAGGVSGPYALLQVVFAFIFGFVGAELTVLTGSLLPAIVWHFVHDFIAIATGDHLDTQALILLAIQCVLLVAYGLFLRPKLTKTTVAPAHANQ